MKTDCDVIRDLLPLYADDACSEQSRVMVNEHLLDCEACRAMLYQLKENEIENSLKQEKNAVIQHGAKKFKQRSAAVGSAISGVFAAVILREGDREYFYAALDRHFPGLKERYIRTYGNAYEVPSPDSAKLMDLFRSFCREHGIMYRPDDCFDYMSRLPEKYRQTTFLE